MVDPSGPPSAFPVVAVGASAGGLESLERFFGAVRKDCGMAFLVAQHLSTTFRSMMAELLGRRTELTVTTAKSGEVIVPGHVYLLSPGKEMVYDDGKVLLEDKDPEVALHLPIDRLFESVGRGCGQRSAGIILSGTGRDGTAGGAVIDALGGVVFAESRGSAKFHGMPSSAIDAGIVSGIYEPEDMPAALVRLFDDTDDGPSASVRGITGLFSEIRKRHDIDFSGYKSATILRRIDRRAQAAQLDRDDYLAKALEDPVEVERLANDFLVTVTRFFRDEESFARLAAIVRLRMESMPEGEPFRAWVAGCATGEEAYSVAMILLEAVEALGQERLVKVFATDINRQSLAVAARGEFDVEALAHVTPQRIGEFFTKTGATFKVKPRLRRSVVFSSQDLLRDAPFTQLHLVTCRNVLIYLDAAAQQRVLNALHFGLVDGGLLMLGPSETTRQLRDLFIAADEHNHMFTKVPSPARNRGLPFGLRARAVSTPRSHRPRRGRSLHDALLERVAPPMLVLDEHRRVVETLGGAERFLRVPRGDVDTDLLSLLDTQTTGAVAGALRALVREDKPVELRRVRLGGEDDSKVVDLRLEPFESGAQVYTIVHIVGRDDEDGSEATNFTISHAAEEEIDVLELELERTREHLQTAVDDLEATNEALQAANEELLASNEELQTTNEELSSVNEELYTVNTEYQQSITELEETNADLHQLLSTTRVGTLFLDAELRIRRFTSLVTEVMDIAESDKGRLVTAFRHGLAWDDFYDRVTDVVGGGDPVEHDTTDRQGRHLLVRILPHVSKAMAGAVVTMTDVTALAEAQSEVGLRQRRLERITNALPVMIAYLDRDLRYQFANDSYLALWSRERQDTIGKRVTEVVGDHARVREALDRALAGERVDAVIDVETPTGICTELVSYVPDVEADEVIGIYVAATDITSRRDMERELERARQEAAEASQAKSDFLANMSHEIRTPMTAIMGHAELLAGKLQDDALHRHVSTIRRNGRHLLTIIGDLLDLSQIEQGRLELKPEPFAPASLVWDVYDLFSVRAEERGLEMAVSMPEELPAVVISDPSRVRQILFNFVSNAVKFTSEGSIVIGIDLETSDGDADSASVMRFWVKDTGVGFPQVKADAMFESFQQLDMSKTRIHEGTGLGLTISSQLATMLGGEITAVGEENKGATFTFALPVGSLEGVDQSSTARDAHRPGSAPEFMPRLRGRILVVDDSRDVRDLVTTALEDAGADVVGLETGVAALDRVRENQDRGQPFDAIVMDVHMPGLDGLETTRVLRRRGFDEPIIALTARAMASDRDECLAAGFTEYLSKPVDLGSLHESLARLVGQPSSPPSQDRPSKNGTPAAGKNAGGNGGGGAMRVLIVDDSEDAAELLAEVLSAQGMEAEVAHSVPQALDRWRSAWPTVMVSDLNFDGEPVGLNLGETVRRESPSATLIAVSGASELEEAALKAGYDHFMLKPFPLDELRSVILAADESSDG